MNPDKLKSLYSINPNARHLFDMLAERSNNAKSTSVERIMQLSSAHKIPISRNEVVGLFKQLAEIGCGRFVTGRRGHSSRLQWAVNIFTLGKAASGELDKVDSLESAPPVLDAEKLNGSVSALTHRFHLRPDHAVTFELPTDLSEKEAQRLAKFIEALPMQNQI
jgi:hypothetical protein